MGTQGHDDDGGLLAALVALAGLGERDSYLNSEAFKIGIERIEADKASPLIIPLFCACAHTVGEVGEVAKDVVAVLEMAFGDEIKTSIGSMAVMMIALTYLYESIGRENKQNKVPFNREGLIKYEVQQDSMRIGLHTEIDRLWSTLHLNYRDQILWQLEQREARAAAAPGASPADAPANAAGPLAAPAPGPTAGSSHGPSPVSCPCEFCAKASGKTQT